MVFDRTSTTDDVLDGVDLSGRRFVVTGASSGLGEESARSLAARGASVTMLARSPEKNAAAAARIRAGLPEADLELGTLDLGELSSIRRCAAEFLEAHDRIDVLVNNAGVMACPEGRTSDGFETQFGTNHLGHFLLTGLLAPALLEAEEPRIVTLSSAAHMIGDVDLDDPNFDSAPYDAWVAYGRSKTANALFADGLARRSRGRNLLSFSVHPGMIMTALGRHLTEELMNEMGARMAERKAEAESSGGAAAEWKTVEQGAATQVWAATTADLADHDGAYLGDCQLGMSGGTAGGTGYAPYIHDSASADRLWTLSEELVGQEFTL